MKANPDDSQLASLRPSRMYRAHQVCLLLVPLMFGLGLLLERSQVRYMVAVAGLSLALSGGFAIAGQRSMVKPKGMWMLREPEDSEASQARESKVAKLMGVLLIGAGLFWIFFGVFNETALKLLHG